MQCTMSTSYMELSLRSVPTLWCARGDYSFVVDQTKRAKGRDQDPKGLGAL